MGKPVLKTLTKEGAVLFWKDDRIIQGGLYGFLTVALLLTYVVLMFYYRQPDRKNLGRVDGAKALIPEHLERRRSICTFPDLLS